MRAFGVNIYSIMVVESELTKQRANPFVDRYVTSDVPVPTLALAMPQPRNLIVQALLLLHECLDGRRLARDAVQLAQAVPMKGSDPELMILLLSSWAELSCRIGRPAAAEVLSHRAKGLITDATHPEVRAAAMLAESIIADATGDKRRREQILRDIIALLSTHSPRRKLYTWDLAMFLAQQGRGIEAGEQIKELTWQTNEHFRIGRVVLVQFVNAVETGAVQEASHLMSQIKTSAQVVSRDLSRASFVGYQALLGLMHAELSDSQTRAEDRSSQWPAWVKVIDALLTRDTETALRLAREEADKLLGSIFSSGFASYNLIRAELASGKPEGAMRLLKMRQDRGNLHYLDDLFMARAERLADNPQAAARHFAELLKSVERYRAKGRLDFELRLACELSHGDVVQLTRAAAKVTRKPRSIFSRDPGDETESDDSKKRSKDAAKRGVNLIIGRSAEIRRVCEEILRFADLEAPVLITGETGTGKEMIARALHESSHRREHPFTAINCGSITETLLESELFGHERGAFTGAEQANAGLFEATGEGSILLDEIGDISPRLQASLLRVLETGEIRAVGSTHTRQIRCRVLAATNVELGRLAEEDHFRKDLLFRLQRLGIHVPPLRRRREDIMLLARHFLDIGRRIGVHARMSGDLNDAIRNYDWPGNVRELRNVIERMRLMHSDKLSYTLDDLGLKFHVSSGAADTAPAHRVAAESIGAGPSPAVPPRQVENRLRPPQPVPPPPPPTDEERVDRAIRGGSSPLRRRERLLELFRKYRHLTRAEVVKVLGVSPNTATSYLKDLCKSGAIRRVEPSASTRSHYFELAEEDNGDSSPALHK